MRIPRRLSVSAVDGSRTVRESDEVKEAEYGVDARGVDSAGCVARGGEGGGECGAAIVTNRQ